MPIQIGQSSPDFSKPIALLSDCHRRIETFLGALARVGEAQEPQLSPENRRALETALRYFREAAPKHTADEEMSLFPRLRSHASPEVTAMLKQISHLEHDHRETESLHDEVDQIGRSWLQAEIGEADRGRFRNAVAKLQSIYGEHIALEDAVVFPAAERTLSDGEKHDVGQEMAERRGVSVLHQIR